ncbi:MAG: TIGR02679 domain-containing protein [bacterium]|nr:TIGR02679 domain-containing protein [bacterium]
MDNLKECAAYFKSRSEWKRPFELFRRKWESMGKTSGKIVLKNCTSEERLAIGKMMGKVYYEHDVTISLTEFENMLQTTRFASVKLHELLEVYFERKIRSKQERKQEKEKKREEFFSNCIEYFACKEEKEKNNVLKWILDMKEKQIGGFTLVLHELQVNEESARKMLYTTGNALIKAFRNEEYIPLAVIAAQVSGNPHYLDRGSTFGNLFMQGICSIQGREYPKSAVEWKERLLGAHILPDDISSMVTTLGIHLQIGEHIHPAVEAFCSMREPLILTALNLREVSSAWVDTKRVYIVENEMVFSYLAGRIGENKTALMCTSGQIRNAAFEVIDLLIKNDTEIYYSGDMDPEGMGIADRLWRKFPERVRIWRMSAEDYQNAVSNEKIEERSLTMLGNLMNPQLKQTAEVILQKKRAAYQENILEDLFLDIIK